jgi:hypothetical protein
MASGEYSNVSLTSLDSSDGGCASVDQRRVLPLLHGEGSDLRLSTALAGLAVVR